MDLPTSTSDTALTQWAQDPVRRNRLQLLVDMAKATAHEVRNPLTTVRGFLQLQQKRISGQTPGDYDLARSQSVPPLDQDRYYSLMIAEIDRIDRLVHEYIQLAFDPSEREPATLSIERTVTDLVPLAMARARLNDVAIEIEGHTDSRILAEEALAKQLLLNVLIKATDATLPGGRVTVLFADLPTDTCVSLACAPPPDWTTSHPPGTPFSPGDTDLDPYLDQIAHACGASVTRTFMREEGGADMLLFHVKLPVATSLA